MIFCQKNNGQGSFCLCSDGPGLGRGMSTGAKIIWGTLNGALRSCRTLELQTNPSKGTLCTLRLDPAPPAQHSLPTMNTLYCVSPSCTGRSLKKGAKTLIFLFPISHCAK